LKLPNFLTEQARSILISLLNRNPYKRLGAGKRDADEIKEHPFFESINWSDAINKKFNVPKPHPKKIVRQEVPLDKLYGKGAFDESLKNHNKVNEWSFIQQ
jgi:hypothetical protein